MQTAHLDSDLDHNLDDDPKHALDHNLDNIDEKVREVDPDSDNISLDSLHIRVLERCVTKYQPPDRCFSSLLLKV